MNKHQHWLRDSALLIVAAGFVLFLHGAIPFLAIPTLGQAIWTTGFSESFANGPWYNIYAHDFGIPKPAAIAFGLAGAWPISLLIRFGLHASDAYTTVFAFWLLVAFYGAYKICRHFDATRPIALIGAVVWMSMPIIWQHAGYSMLSLGIGLLPFYFLASVNIFWDKTGKNKITLPAVLFYSLTTIVAVFMDGYSFMMFATGASIFLAYAFISRPEARKSLLTIALPVHIASFALAYVLFSAYIGKSNFNTAPIDFFRGWGLDLSFAMFPTQGVHWLPDLLGLSLKRSNVTYFGDASVWATTFSLPIILAGLIAWWRVKKNVKLATGALLVATFGFYMALGPSLKIDSTKPESLQLSHPREQSVMMPADLAIMPTGNAWISENLPGFNIMRASYRWLALGVFAFWMLVMIWVTRTEGKDRIISAVILIALITLNLPSLPKKWQKALDARMMFHQIDNSLITELRQQIKKGEVVAFLPWGNDFIVNYLAPKAGFQTFNIGGDKNLYEAQMKWPPEMLLLGEELKLEKASSLAKMLINGSADVISIPYFHTLWSLSAWPCADETTITKITEEQIEELRRLPGFVCPSQRKIELSPIIKHLASLPYLEVKDSNLFASIRLRSNYMGHEKRKALMATLISKVHYPIIVGSKLEGSAFIFGEGWHTIEANHVWSQAKARLTLPIPKDCMSRQCTAVLKFIVFGANQDRPVVVNFNTDLMNEHWSEEFKSTAESNNQISIPLDSAKKSQEINISVPNATSPQALAGSPDHRVLGIGLQRIELSIEP
ncbi:MAG: putative rane protein [Gammaproteobacteria bacterium]|jgi:hypothetical protein|nr:putative rane protein [Gammaproteobacteria bacterium]